MKKYTQGGKKSIEKSNHDVRAARITREGTASPQLQKIEPLEKLA
jgi:hypothetical protein